VHVDEKYKELKLKQDEKTKDFLNKRESTILSKKLTRNNINHFSEFDELTLDITNDKLNKNERKIFKKLPTVKSYEVKTIGGFQFVIKNNNQFVFYLGYEMSLRFQILKFDLNTVMNKVFFYLFSVVEN